MPKNADLLVEIQTEELPPKALFSLAKSFCDEIKKRLTDAKLEFAGTEFFATPRRLAVYVKNLISKQPDINSERRGPAWQAAFDAAGKPTGACIGFARSCGIAPEQLITIENAQGKWVGYKQAVAGKTVQQLLPEIIQLSLNALPIPKRMRWGCNNAEFVRPIHSVILMYGTKVIPAVIFNYKTGQTTLGHRFLCKKSLKISSPEKYADILEKQGYVIADFAKRKNKIKKEAEALITKKFGGKASLMMNEALLDEVTGIVEWPVAILGEFDKAFLKVPQEALTSAMQDHQRYFPVVDKNNKLLPYFVAISNIKSRKPQQVIKGNERVLRARLSDAAFFFETDKKIKLADHVEKLKGIVFQAKLGTLLEKADRMKKLANMIAIDSVVNLDPALAKQAALFSKADLTTELVGEFPELQGIAGYYYALHEGVDEAVANAIKEHYQPRFSGDILPESLLGCVIALADRVDTLTGMFRIDLFPTGDKDPYGLRRAALSVLRILIEKPIVLDLKDLLNDALHLHGAQPAVLDKVWSFFMERLKPWYQEKGVNADVFAAVAALNITKPYDFDCRIQAVQTFKKLAQAEALSIANKRVSNILTQYDKPIHQNEMNTNLFEHEAERHLAKVLDQYGSQVSTLVTAAKYQEALKTLANLREPVDAFFDHVMVMVDDLPKRENRLFMLKKLRALFLQVADIALLQQ